MSRSAYDRPIRKVDATARIEVAHGGRAKTNQRKNLGLSKRATICHDEWMEKTPCRFFRRPFRLTCKYCGRWFLISKEQSEAFDAWVAADAKPKKGEA